MSSPPLDLPGELKNLIYNLEVPETTMHVPSSGAITVFFSDAEQAYTSVSTCRLASFFAPGDSNAL